MLTDWRSRQNGLPGWRIHY